MEGQGKNKKENKLNSFPVFWSTEYKREWSVELLHIKYEYRLGNNVIYLCVGE